MTEQGPPSGTDSLRPPAMARVNRLRRFERRRLRLFRLAAALTCVLALALGSALFFPTQPGPVLGVAAELRARDQLYAAETEVFQAALAGREVTLSLGEDCLAVLVSELIRAAGGQGEVWVSSREEVVRVWLRLATPVGIPAVVELRIQPSLLEGSLFCGLRGARVGLCPFPLSWQLALRGASNPGWAKARGSYGYAFPGRFKLRGQLVDVVDVWSGDGMIEVTLRPVLKGGD